MARWAGRQAEPEMHSSTDSGSDSGDAGAGRGAKRAMPRHEAHTCTPPRQLSSAQRTTDQHGSTVPASLVAEMCDLRPQLPVRLALT